jgi:hypothetical protein
MHILNKVRLPTISRERNTGLSYSKRFENLRTSGSQDTSTDLEKKDQNNSQTFIQKYDYSRDNTPAHNKSVIVGKGLGRDSSFQKMKQRNKIILRNILEDI